MINMEIKLMLKLKKTTGAAVALMSSAIFAGSMGPLCTPGAVNVPCEHRGWDVGARALYLQSSLGSFNTPAYVTASSGEQFFQNNGNAWDWGFMVEGSYHFSTGKDVNLNWYQLSNNQKLNLPGLFTTTSGNPVLIGPGVYNTKQTWDAVNLEIGQQVDFFQNSSIRFHGGVEYVRVDFHRTLSSRSGNAVRTSTYNGFGPRVGTDGLYTFANGISLYANGALGLYAGSSTYHSSLFGFPFRSVSSMVVVPELEAKLGASYNYMMAHGNLSFDAGWMWVNYIGALTNAFSGVAQSENFGIQGPYIGLRWVGNLA